MSVPSSVSALLQTLRQSRVAGLATINALSDVYSELLLRLNQADQLFKNKFVRSELQEVLDELNAVRNDNARIVEMVTYIEVLSQQMLGVVTDKASREGDRLLSDAELVEPLVQFHTRFMADRNLKRVSAEPKRDRSGGR